jgi:hypothetical protein
MADNELKIKIGGDVSEFTAAAKEASEALGTFTGLTNQTSGLRKIASDSAEAAVELKKVQEAAENIIPEGSVAEARETVKQLKGEIESLSGTQLKSEAGQFLVSELKLAEQELKKLQVEAGLAKEKVEKIIPPKLPLGAIQEARARIKDLQNQILSLNASQIQSGYGKAIAADLKIAEKELVALEAQAGLTSANTGNLLNKAFGGLRQIANILPGIGIAGIIGFATEPIVKYVSSLIGAKDETAAFNKALEDANKKAGDEISRVQVLNAVITDNTRSQTERSNAAKELSGILKDLNIKMSQEAILNGQVAEATQRATDAIISRAKARAIENRIADLSGEQLQRDLKRKEATDKLTKATADLNRQEQINRQVIGSGSVPGIGQNAIAATQEVISLQNEIKNIDTETAKANKEIQSLISNITDADLNVDLSKGETKEVDLLKQRIAALKEIQSLQGLTAAQQVELAQLEIKLVNRDGVKNGLNADEIKQQADAILEKAFPVKTFEYQTVITTRVNKLESSVVKDAAALTKDFKTDIAKAIGLDGKPLEVPMPPVTFTNVKTPTKIALEKLKDAINQQIQTAFVDVGATLAEAIGNGFSSGKDIFTSIMSILGAGLEQIGKALLAYGASVLALQISLDSLNPFVALAAGIAAIAAGQALKNSVPKLAKGGIATGPTLGIFGEAGKEAIIPLDRLPDIVGKLSMNTDANVMLSPTLRFSLTDMELSLERVRSSRRRLG